MYVHRGNICAFIYMVCTGPSLCSCYFWPGYSSYVDVIIDLSSVHRNFASYCYLLSIWSIIAERIQGFSHELVKKLMMRDASWSALASQTTD
jgi:hypothetical protein